MDNNYKKVEHSHSHLHDDYDNEEGHEHQHKRHGTNNEAGPWKYMIQLQDEHSHHLNKLNEHHDRRVRRGATFHLVMTLGNTDTTSRIAYIDLVRGKNKNGSKNLPSDSSDDFPFTKVYNITIINRTGGADINYNINRGPNGTSMFGLIKAGAERTFDSLYPVYENLNVARAAGGTATSVVELICIT